MTAEFVGFKGIVVSDIHTCHPNTPTEHILKNLDKYITNRNVLAEHRVLFIAGDFFDRLIDYAHEDGILIDKWIRRMLRKAAASNTIVVVLEGTKSHDRGQNVRFVANRDALERSGIPVPELHYITEPSILRLDKLAIDVLMIPDNCFTTAADGEVVVKGLLEQAGLEKVDYAIMHGMFRFQAPKGIEHVANDAHREDFYLGITRKMIAIGHVHTAMSYERIHGQGSFDRTAHNQEEKKGFISFENTQEGFIAKFVENKDAMTYLTIPLISDDIGYNLAQIEEAVRDLREDSHVRISAVAGNPVIKNMSLLKERWPAFNWSQPKVITDGEEEVVRPLVDMRLNYTPIAITPQNLYELMQKRLQSKSVDPVLARAALGILRDNLEAR